MKSLLEFNQLLQTFLRKKKTWIQKGSFNNGYARKKKSLYSNLVFERIIQGLKNTAN